MNTGMLYTVGKLVVAQFGSAPSAPAKADASAPLNFDKVLPAGLTDISDLSRWWQNISTFFATKGLELLSNLVAAIAIFVIGRWVAKFITRMVRNISLRANVDETLVKFVTNLVYAALLAFVALSSLNRLGVDTASFTAVVAAAGLAVGFALQGSLSNFAAGVLLIMFKPFKVGDTVQAGGSNGVVEEIQIFNTILKTDNNAHVIVPNSAITNGTITNFSTERIRRIDLVIRCGYEDDLRAVKRFLVETLNGDERVLNLPPAQVAVEQLADSHVAFSVQPWVKSEYYAAVRADLLEDIKIGFEHRGFRMCVAAKPAAPTATTPAAKAG